MAKAGPPLGNTNATKNKPFAEAIDRALKKKNKTDQAAGLLDVAEKLIALAESGDLQAIKELADRTDGKSKQSTELTGTLAITHEEWLDDLEE